jgi:cytochrome P450
MTMSSTDALARLRGGANWSFLRPQRSRLQRQFTRRLQAHLDRAEPGSLAHLLASTPATPETDPTGQTPQWLFAFDAAGMAAYRTLALLATHRAEAARAMAELAEVDMATSRELPYLRACVLESVRLWPTTPVILRDTTTVTRWSGATMSAGVAVAIIAPFLHRDDETVPYADHFSPEIWLDGTAEASPSLAPFSAGPAACAGRNLVLLTTSALLAALLERHAFALTPPRLDPHHRLPGTLSPFNLTFTVTRRA